MEYDFIRQRITQLREQKGIAEYRIKSYAGVWGNKSGLCSDAGATVPAAFAGVHRNHHFDTMKRLHPLMHPLHPDLG